jgi:hypothetical protein
MRSFRRIASGAAAAAAFLLLVVTGGAFADDRVLTCRKEIGKAGASLVRAILSVEQGCQERLLHGNLLPGVVCMSDGSSTPGINDPATLAKIQKAIAQARATVAQRCADLPISTPAPGGLGMPALCPGTDQACAEPVNDLPSLLACLQCTHVSIAHALVALPYATTTAAHSAQGIARTAP